MALFADRERPNRGRKPLLFVGMNRVARAAKFRSPCISGRRRCLAASQRSWFDIQRRNLIFSHSSAVVNSSRSKRRCRLGESGGQGELPQQRQPQGVHPRNGEPRLSRIRRRSGKLRHDGFHLHGNNGGRGFALEGTGPRPSSRGPLRRAQPRSPDRSRARPDFQHPCEWLGRAAVRVAPARSRRPNHPAKRNRRTPGRCWMRTRRLCEAAPENFPRFKDVLDYLKQDLHHETASK